MKYFFCLMMLLIGTCGLSTATYECVLYDRNLMETPCTSNPTVWAYIDNQVTDVGTEMNYTNALIQGLKVFSAPYGECGLYAPLWFCQNPDFSTRKLPMLNCATDEFNQPIVVPVPTCQDLCYRMRAACDFAFALFNYPESALPQCATDYTNDGVTVNGVHFPCWNVTPGEDQAVNATCPEDTVPNGQFCYPRCPSPEYTESNINSLELMQQIVAWISFVSAAVMGCLWIRVPFLRIFPSRIVLCVLVATMPLSLAFMLATFVGGSVNEVWCGHQTSYSPIHIAGKDDRAINDSGLCVFQAWLIQYGTLCVASWWAAIAINTALLLRASDNFKAQSSMVKTEIAYHVIGWGLPLILCIISTAGNQMDYETSSTYCFISSANNEAWRIALWFVPMGIALVIGSAGLIACLWYASRNLNVSKVKTERLSQLVRLILCLIIYFVAVTLIFASQILNSVNLEDNVQGLVWYLICSLGGNPGCRDALYQRTKIQTQFELSMASSFFMCALGSLLVIFFGTSTAFLNNAISTSRGGSSENTSRNTSRS